MCNTAFLIGIFAFQFPMDTFSGFGRKFFEGLCGGAAPVCPSPSHGHLPWIWTDYFEKFFWEGAAFIWKEKKPKVFPSKTSRRVHGKVGGQNSPY
jgi:hypothetical protein